MKQFKVYKINAKSIVWGLDLSYFYIFMAVIVICVFVVISNITFTKFLVVSLVIGTSYITLKMLSEKDHILSLLKEKLPKRIRNSL